MTTSKTTTLTGWHRLLEAGLIIFVMFAAYVLVALMSFDAQDASWSQTSQIEQVANKGGLVGAWIADILLFSLGWLAYFVPIAISGLGFLLFQRFIKLQELDFITLSLRLLGVVLFLAATTAISSINFDDIYYFSSGGFVGDVIADALLPVFNFIGTSIILLAFFMTGITLMTGLSWVAAVEWIGDMLVSAVSRLLAWFKQRREHHYLADTDRPALAEPKSAPRLSNNKPEAVAQQSQPESVAMPESKPSKRSWFTRNKSTPTELVAMPDHDASVDGAIRANREPSLALDDLDVDDDNMDVVKNMAAQALAEQSPLQHTQASGLSRAPLQGQSRAQHSSASHRQERREPEFGDSDIDTDPFSTLDDALSDDFSFSALDDDDIDFDQDADFQPAPKAPVHPSAPKVNGGVSRPLTAEQRFAELMAEPKASDMPPLPDLSLLDRPNRRENPITPEEMERMSRLVEAKLLDFNIEAQVVGVYPGPVITRFELDLAPGVKVSKITSLSKDLARSLSAISVRVVEVIPGKSVIGLELPNRHREIVRLSEVIACEKFTNSTSNLTMVLGCDIAGLPVVVDLAKMPHLLVAGTTGSGKSVGVNVMIISLLYKSSPEDVRMIMIDPKMLELSVYEGIPHLLCEVVTDMKEAANALRWCVGEMERRYKLMSALGVRNLKGYNAKILEAIEMGEAIRDPLWKPGDSMDEQAPLLEKLPSIVVVIDEFADMMMIVGKKVEELIARIAQKARAAGIHLVLATQRPSVDVITGLIKANIPTRMAFQVSSKIDSRTILDQMGAENLLGQGDMLYLPPGSGVPTRVHGAFVDDHEVHAVVNDWKKRGKPNYIAEILSGEGSDEVLLPGEVSSSEDDPEADHLYDEAVQFVIESRRASVSSVQRRFRIGYNRAARLVDQMEAAGIVSSPQHNGTREVLVKGRE